MTEKLEALIIYSDGSTEQKLPLPLTFFEGMAQSFARQAEQLKQQVMIQPPQPEDEQE